MGLDSGHTTNYVVEDLSFTLILLLLQQRKLRRLTSRGGPVVDVDASWVIRKYVNMSYDMRILQEINKHRTV
jgi:hypothetical protein